MRTLGPHPADKELIAVRKGRFGPYVQHGKTVANLPRGVMMEDITLDEAVALLAEKGKQLKPKGRRPAEGRRCQAGAGRQARAQGGGETGAAPAKRAAPKKAAAKKPAVKKAGPEEEAGGQGSRSAQGSGGVGQVAGVGVTPLWPGRSDIVSCTERLGRAEPADP